MDGKRWQMVGKQHRSREHILTLISFNHHIIELPAHKKMTGRHTFQIQGKPFGPVFDYAAIENSTIKKSQVLALYLRALEMPPTDIIQVETFLHDDPSYCSPITVSPSFPKGCGR